MSVNVKERIILGAINAMSINGVKNTTMDSVASSLGISKRTIYENFTDKRDLISVCVDHLISEQERAHKLILEGSHTIVEELFKMLDLFDFNQKINGRMALDVKRQYPEIYYRLYITHYDRSQEAISDQLLRGIEQGLILKETNINFAVYVIMETVNMLMLNPEKMLSSTKVASVDAFKYVLIYFFRGIATKKGIEQIDKIIATKRS